MAASGLIGMSCMISHGQVDRPHNHNASDKELD